MAEPVNARDNLTQLLTPRNETDDQIDLYIYGDIVSSWWGAWTREDTYPTAIKDFIQKAAGKRINMHINSGGGSVFAGMAIYNLLKNYEGEVVTYIDGQAASIASVIALAGDRIIMRTGSAIMIHKPAYCLWGAYNADDFRHMADDLDEIQRAIMQVYRENKAKDADEADASLGASSNGGFAIRALLGNEEGTLVISGPCTSELAVGTLQNGIDALVKECGVSVDYIHGESALQELVANSDNIGFVLPGMDKFQLFPAVAADGALPRKTFSMGEANEKRYYIEARKIK